MRAKASAGANTGISMGVIHSQYLSNMSIKHSCTGPHLAKALSSCHDKVGELFFFFAKSSHRASYTAANSHITLMNYEKRTINISIHSVLPSLELSVITELML